MVYEFRSGVRKPAGTSAEEVGAALEQIEREHGKVTTTTVTDTVEAAYQDRQEHPLLPWFTWDEELGMRKLHEIESQHVVRAVYLKDVADDQKDPVRAWVGVVYQGEKQYKRIDVVVRDQDMRDQLLQEVSESQERANRKFRELLELVRLAG